MFEEAAKVIGLTLLSIIAWTVVYLTSNNLVAVIAAVIVSVACMVAIARLGRR